MNVVKISDPLIDKVLDALGMDDDKDFSIRKLTVTLEVGEPAVVEINKWVIDKEKSK